MTTAVRPSAQSFASVIPPQGWGGAGGNRKVTESLRGMQLPFEAQDIFALPRLRHSACVPHITGSLLMRKDKALFIILVWLMICVLFGVAEMLGGIHVQNGGRQLVTLGAKACCFRIFTILLPYIFTQHTKILFNSIRSKAPFLEEK